MIIRGARQVGKSHLVRLFARENELTLVEVNLERHLHLNAVFATNDTAQILKELEAISGQSVLAPRHLLFLDEIQATPNALPALRYLHEDHPELLIVAAGSLLEFTLKDHVFSMPVGRIDYLHLGPMSFEEYLLACGEDYLYRLMKNFQIGENFPQSAHQKLMQRQREYMLVGGLPEAMQTYVKTQSLKSVFAVQQSILSTYMDDFAKYMRNKNDLLRLQTVFRYIPGNVGHKIKYANISRLETSTNLKTALQLLSLARVITPVSHTSASGLPLAASADSEVYKCLFLDVGLMNRILGLDWTAISSMDERALINEGGLAEQFVGQHLLYRHEGQEEPVLHYWLREGSNKNAEVDFVISEGNWIIPVEVKAGKSGSLKSILQFCYQKNPPVAVRFDANLPSLESFQHRINTPDGIKDVKFRMLSLPLYMVGELQRLVTVMRENQ